MKTGYFMLLKKLTGVCVFVFLANFINAADIVTPLWNLNNINSQSRFLTTDYSGTSAIIGGASKTGTATNNTLTINGLNISAASDPQTAHEEGTDTLIGGAVYNNTASQNSVQVINGSTIQGRTVIGGAALLGNWDDRAGSGSAYSNSILIKDSSVIKDSYTYSYNPPGALTPTTVTVDTGGDVYGGFVNYVHGNADNNSITIDNSFIEGDVYGSYVTFTTIPNVDYEENGDLTNEFVPDINVGNNTVKILNGSVVNGTVYGARGQDKVSDNTIEIDGSTVNSVYGGSTIYVVYNSDNTTNTYSNNNTVIIRNGANVGNVSVGGGDSTNATGNKLIVDNATISDGLIRSAVVPLRLRNNGEIPVNAVISKNSISINDLPSPTAWEIGAGLNLAGTSNENTTTLTNMANLTIDRPTKSFDVLDATFASTANLLSLKDFTGTVVSNNFNNAYGFIYGGAALDYTSQVNNIAPSGGVLPSGATNTPDVVVLANGGKQADGNNVTVSNSKINANIVGGFAGEIREIYYSNWSGSGSIFTKDLTAKIGNEIVVMQYTCDADGQNCINETLISRNDYTGFTSTEFSASNNTVVLDNVDFDGTVYGGYVAGADLNINDVKTSNNTVIIRGNTSLSSTSVIYGGNAYLGSTTNKLVFDHVSGTGNTFITYDNPNQFQNFSTTYDINADLNTRIDFRLNNVDAIVNIDNPSKQEGTATIIKTQTNSDLTDVQQNGVITDLVDTTVELSQEKLGVYSYNLVGTKEDATTIAWVLSIIRDHQNAEVYGQVPLVGLALTTEGANMLNKALSEAWQSHLDSGSFFDGGYNHTRYHTGSGFDLDSFIMQAGFWKKFSDEMLGGLFVKYANGSYETFPIKANGNANAFSGGLMTSLRYSQTGSIVANAEVGYLDLDFKSNSLASTLTSKGIYYGALVGVEENLLPSWLMYTNLQYLRKDKDSMTDNLGQSIDYQAMQSIAFRAGTEIGLTSLTFADFVPSIGVSCIYEFDGKSKVEVAGTANDEASMKGFSGRGEIGLTYNSDKEAFPLISKLTLFGLAGKRSGLGGEVNISFRF